MELFSAFYSSPIGWLHLQSTNEHITAIHFTELTPNNQENHLPFILQQWTAQLDEYFSGSRKVFDLPLQLSGSSFQVGVWNNLLRIPYGKSISYRDLARQMGDAKAIRAVAAANGKNKIAIIVPCHRVIGSNAALVGYAGGLWRKKWLLEHESKYQSGLQLLPF